MDTFRIWTIDGGRAEQAVAVESKALAEPQAVRPEEQLTHDVSGSWETIASPR
jgi:hypothetical protein